MHLRVCVLLLNKNNVNLGLPYKYHGDLFHINNDIWDFPKTCARFDQKTAQPKNAQSMFN